MRFDEHSKTALVRWMGTQGFNFKEAKTALTHYGIDVADATIKTQLQSGKSGRQLPAPVTPEQATALRSIGKGGVALPPTSLPKPATSLPKPALKTSKTEVGKEPPRHITKTGEPDEFAQRVYMAIKGDSLGSDDRLRDADHARAVGKLIYEEIKKDPQWTPVVVETPRFLELRKRRLQLFREIDIAPSPEIRNRLQKELEIIEKEYIPMSEEIIDSLGPEVNKKRGAVVLKVLNRIRDMGGETMDMSGHAAAKQECERIQSTYLPKDWTDQARRRFSELQVKVVERGFFDRIDHVIAISGRTKQEFASTALHESMHAVAYSVPNAIKLETEFLQSRIGPKEKRKQISRKDWGYEDEFEHHYCGKVYGEVAPGRELPGKVPTVRSTEILTMGTESLFQTRSDNFFKDDDYVHFMLGCFGGL